MACARQLSSSVFMVMVVYSLLADTVPWSHGEGLQDIAPVIDEAWISRVHTGEPTLWKEALRFKEVAC